METPVMPTDLDDETEDGITSARERLREFDERARAFARENPVACVVGAVAVGFFIGKLAARL